MILACVHAAHRCSYCLHVVCMSYRIIHVYLRLVNRFPDTRLSPASLTPRCGRTSIWLPDKMCSCMLQYESSGAAWTCQHAAVVFRSKHGSEGWRNGTEDVLCTGACTIKQQQPSDLEVWKSGN